MMAVSAAVDRLPRNEHDVVFLAVGQETARFGFANLQAVVDLVADNFNRTDAASVMKAFARKIADADIADKTATHQFAHPTHGVSNGNVVAGMMHHIEVEIFTGHAGNRTLCRSDQIVVSEVMGEGLGSYEQIFARISADGLANQLLGMTSTVHLGGVDVRNAGIDGASDGLNAFGVVRATGCERSAHPPGSETVSRHPKLSGC